MNSRAKFVSVKIKNFFELALANQSVKSIEIKLIFLGSLYPAATYAKGEPYGNNNDIYYLRDAQAGRRIFTLTFSGPTALDIRKPNIRSITLAAKNTLTDLIADIRSIDNSTEPKEIVVSIVGHSRGGIVAQTIYRWLASKSNDLNKEINLGKLNLADPYAGPINRRLHKRQDNFDKLNENKYSQIPLSKVTVYTTKEKRFRDPAQSLKSNTIVFSDTSHDGTRYIANFIFNSNKTYNEKLYICPDPCDTMNKISLRSNYNPNEEEQTLINEHIEKALKPVDQTNLEKILNGADEYKNFAYSKIASDGRRKLFYTAIAMANKGEYRGQIKEFLESHKHKSMQKAVEKNLLKLGFPVT